MAKRILLKGYSMPLSVPFSDKEKIDGGRRLAAIETEITNLEGNLATEVKKQKAVIGARKQERQQLAGQINSGTKLAEVPVEEYSEGLEVFVERTDKPRGHKDRLVSTRAKSLQEVEEEQRALQAEQAEREAASAAKADKKRAVKPVTVKAEAKPKKASKKKSDDFEETEAIYTETAPAASSEFAEM